MVVERDTVVERDAVVGRDTVVVKIKNKDTIVNRKKQHGRGVLHKRR